MKVGLIRKIIIYVFIIFQGIFFLKRKVKLSIKSYQTNGFRLESCLPKLCYHNHKYTHPHMKKTNIGHDKKFLLIYKL